MVWEDEKMLDNTVDGNGVPWLTMVIADGIMVGGDKWDHEWQWRMIP